MLARLIGPDVGRVLMTADAVGGVWQYSLELAAGLVDHGIDVTLAVMGPVDAAKLNAVRVPKLRIVNTGLPLDWMAGTEHEVYEAGQALVDLAESTGADLVHLHSPAYAADVRFQAPCVAVAHSCVATWWRALHDTPLPQDLAWKARRMARGLATADTVIAVSHSFANDLRQAYGPRAPIVVVPNGKRTRYYPRVRRRRCAFTAGRLWDRAKNVAAIDRAAARMISPVYAAGPTAGPNGEATSFANLQLLGELSGSDIGRWQSSSAVFVSMAQYEPFGLGVLEAAQAGTALVLSDIPTFRELWDGAALFCGEDELPEALESLIAAPERCAELGARAQQRAARYGRLAMVQGTLAAYRSPVDSPLRQRA